MAPDGHRPALRDRTDQLLVSPSERIALLGGLNGWNVSKRACDVVIATRNRPEVLARSLSGLLTQTCRDFRVIVVDDHSDEPVADLVADSRFDPLERTVIRLPEQSGPAAARNAGVAAVTADYVVFVDDDVVAGRDFVAAHLTAVRRERDDGKPIVSCGPFVQPADWDATPWNLWEARQAKKEADALGRGEYQATWRQCHTGNNCMPVEVFRAVGGFDPRFKRAEDDELALRLEEHGCHFHYEPAALAWHYSHRSLEAWLAIPRAYAHFDVEIDRQHPEAGYLDSKRRELRRRRFPLRLTRQVFRSERGTRLGVKWSIGAAEALARRGRTDLSMAALSIAYDLSYCRSLRESMAGPAAPERSGSC